MPSIAIFMKFTLFVASTLLLSASAAETGTRHCPGGYTQGTYVDRGHYWYQCLDGQLVPKGCLTDDSARIGIMDTYDSHDVRLQCVVSKDGYLSYAYKACVYGGRERRVDETWDDGGYWYECKRNDGGVGLRINKRGCVDQGRRLNFDERVIKGDFVYVCEETKKDSPTSELVGCVKDGRKYNLADIFESADRWYVCTNEGVKCVGCLHNGQRLKNNDRYFVDDVVYECVVEGEKTRVEAFGCVQNDNGATIERKLGCSWMEGQAPFKYEMTCKSNPDTKTAVKIPTKCYYKSVEVQPGCFQITADKTVVGCVRDTNDIKTRIFQTSDMDSVIASGLRQC